MKYITSALQIFAYLLAFNALYYWALIRFVPSINIANYKKYRGSSISLLSTLLFNSIWVVAVFDSQLPGWKSLLMGCSLIIFGLYWVVWARKVNPYFVPVLLKPDRIVIEGPYKYLSHPGYFGFSALSLGIVVLLCSTNAAYMAVFYNFLLLIRVFEESDLLAYSQLPQRAWSQKPFTHL